MKRIQPVQTWVNGEEQFADGFLMSINSDNMSTVANFSYQLVKITNTWEPKILVSGQLIIDGEDYQTWDADPSANEWAYNWAATQLNLVLLP